MEDELLQAFCFPTGKISQRRCIACHNQEERTYVLLMDTYGMQLSWLWHVTQCIIYIHTCIKMFFYIFHSGLLSRWDESKHVFCHHHPHKSVMKGFVSPNELTGCFVWSIKALFSPNLLTFGSKCQNLPNFTKECHCNPRSQAAPVLPTNDSLQTDQ